jgi:hypothetical protein
MFLSKNLVTFCHITRLNDTEKSAPIVQSVYHMVWAIDEAVFDSWQNFFFFSTISSSPTFVQCVHNYLKGSFVFAVESRMDAAVAVTVGTPPPPPAASLARSTIGTVYYALHICCVQSICCNDQIAGPEIQHHKRSAFCILVRQSVVLGPLPLRGSNITSPLHCVLYRSVALKIFFCSPTRRGNLCSTL